MIGFIWICARLGLSDRTMSQLFKMSVNSILEFAAPVWNDYEHQDNTKKIKKYKPSSYKNGYTTPNFVFSF